MEETFMYDQQPRGNKRATIAIISVVVVIALAFAAAALVSEFVLTTFIVDGPSMNPTLDGGGPAEDDGETMVLNKIANIKRGQIVVFLYDWSGASPRKLVKRVIGVAGDHIQIINNVLYINGTAQNEGYIAEPMYTADLDIVVSNGHIFCMGDNRNDSYDSRMIGEVPLDNVIGKCILILDTNGGIRFPKKK